MPGSGPQRLHLFCLPHAGGNAALYRGWREHLPHDITLHLINLPARRERLQDPLPDNLNTLANQLAEAIGPQICGHWALFGHSMGAVVAHELLLALQRRGHAPPVLLAVSAREAPQFHRPGTLHQQSDDRLCAELLKLGGTEEALLAMPEVRGLILPAVRGDYRLIERWQPSSTAPMPCAIAAFAGRQDTELSVEQAQGWAQWSEIGFSCDLFHGGHFYFSANPQPVIHRLVERLRTAQSGRICG